MIRATTQLSTEVLVADTPEYYTSQICSKCGGKCGPFEALEANRRVCNHPWLRVMTKEDETLEESQEKLDKLVQAGSTVGSTQLRGSFEAEPVLEISSDEVDLQPS